MDDREDAYRYEENIASNDEEIFYEKLWKAGILVLTDNLDNLKIR